MLDDTERERDPIDWFVMLGDDLKRPMMENVRWLDDEEAETMELVFDWVEAYLEHDGFEQTIDRLVARGLSEKDSRSLTRHVIEERLPKEVRRVGEVELVSELPEDRQGVEMLDDDPAEASPS